MNYVPPHLKVIVPELEKPKTSFTETNENIKVTTNSPYGTLETLKTLNSAKGLPYEIPTVIQKYAIPVVLKGHPLQCRAPTGMGKTMCFLLPLIEKMRIGLGPQICIISPTRELCEQIKDEALKIKKNISIECLYGGVHIRPNTNANIIVAAPGKLLHYLKENKIVFNKIASFVLDEADKLLEMGFDKDILQIKAYVPKTASVFLFSATFPKKLNEIIESVLPENKVTIEIQNETLTNIKQMIYKVDSKEEKLKEILIETNKTGEKHKILIFGEMKVTVQRLHSKIESWGFSAVCLQGDMLQPERQIAMGRFKTDKVSILVATSVAARGIDVKDVFMVINYDFPKDISEYIHRIGRTGRQGKEGTAVSFLDNAELSNFALQNELVEILKASKSEVPSFLLERKESKWRGRKPEVRGIGNQIRKMSFEKQESSTTTIDKKIEYSTEKADVEEDLSGGW